MIYVNIFFFPIQRCLNPTLCSISPTFKVRGKYTIFYFHDTYYEPVSNFFGLNSWTLLERIETEDISSSVREQLLRSQNQTEPIFTSLGIQTKLFCLQFPFWYF